jgi:hypothetical protein
MSEDTGKQTTRTTKPKGLTLVQKLLEVRKSVDYLQKSSSGSQFKYTSSSQVLSAVRAKMNEMGLLLESHINESRVNENVTKTGTVVYFTELVMTMVWIDSDTGEERAMPWYAQGVDLAGEKGVGKALTYAEKYFILKQFNIPTDKDDPDSFQEKNAPQIDMKTKLIGDLKAATQYEQVTKIWSENPKFKDDPDFVEAVKVNGTRLKPKEPTANA